MIPKTIHYLFGLDCNFCNKPFEYFHYLNILSAVKINSNYNINFYYYHRPNSIFFDKLNDICNLIKIENIEVYKQTHEFAYTEHLSDFIRLDLLYKFGGIYLDIDTICIKPFDDLLQNKFVLGYEMANQGCDVDEVIIGLCNAAMMSEKNSLFSQIWIDDYYKNYNSIWNYNSVVRPLELYYKNPELIHVEPRKSFFKYSWDENGKRQMFDQNLDTSDCYSLHLWESKNYHILSKYDEEYIKCNNDTVSNLYKKYT